MGYKQGRFAFRYTGFAFQKGPDGEPEIIPKDAQTIRMIVREFLNGDSLKGIKEKLEKASIPSPCLLYTSSPRFARKPVLCEMPADTINT